MGKTYRSLKEMGQAMERRLEKNGETHEQAFKEMVDASYIDHVTLLGGHLSPSQTRGAFARGMSPSLPTNPRAGRRLLSSRQIKLRGLKKVGAPLLPVNIRTGNLLERLKKRGPIGPDHAYRIADTAPYAAFQMGAEGTRIQVARGYSQEIRKRWKLYLSSYTRVLRARLK